MRHLSVRRAKYALLNDGLETIGEGCFSKSGLERVSIPNTVKCIHGYAFSCSSLTQVCFLGTHEKEPHHGHSFDNAKSEPSENAHLLVIGEGAFFGCKNLRQVVFEPGSAVEEIQCRAFYRSDLESFTAPQSLRKIGIMTFGECLNLRTFELNECIQELSWFCLWRSEVTDLHLPLHLKITRE